MTEPMRGRRRVRWGVAALGLCALLFTASAIFGYPAAVFCTVGAIAVVAVIAVARGLSERDR
ncbi:hypothetical protein GCM10010277_85690 [Streptomyces longisporoflavus]|nr:hypothetical protein GCM10010277_85690 [Streptomyces longisporoflavus]